MRSPRNNNKNCNNKLSLCRRQETLKEAGKKSQTVSNCETEARAMTAGNTRPCMLNAVLCLTQLCFQNKSDRGRVQRTPKSSFTINRGHHCI